MSSNRLDVLGADFQKFDLYSWYLFVREKWISVVTVTIVICTVFFACSFFIPNRYTATATLMLINSNNDDLSSLAGKLGGVASLAGINIDGGGDTDKGAVAIELMHSWHFIEKFIVDHDLSPLLFAVREWDLESKTILFDVDIYDVKSGRWRGDHRPTSWELFEKFTNSLSVVKDSKTGFVRISFTHFSPKEASAILTALISAVNIYMKDQDKEAALQSIQYLKKQIGLTTNESMKSIFYQLIEEQTKSLLLTEIRSDYVLQIIAPPMEPQMRSSPNRIAMTLSGAVVGALLSLFTLSFIYIKKGA